MQAIQGDLSGTSFKLKQEAVTLNFVLSFSPLFFLFNDDNLYSFTFRNICLIPLFYLSHS
jgi:hypothetical protein